MFTWLSHVVLTLRTYNHPNESYKAVLLHNRLSGGSMKFELSDFAKKAYIMTTPKKAVQQNVSKQCPCSFIGIIGFWVHDAVVNIQCNRQSPNQKTRNFSCFILFFNVLFYSYSHWFTRALTCIKFVAWFMRIFKCTLV